MIIAVDFDGTICINGKPNDLLISKLKANKRKGDCIILWTCREGKSLIEAVEFMKKNGIQPNLVNQNHPEIIRRMGRDSRKIYADIYIDDKAVKYG